MNLRPFALFAALLVTPFTYADQAADVQHVSREWERVNFTLDKPQQVPALEALIKQTAALTRQYPDAAEAWIWDGIVHSTYAGAKGGLGALSECKTAKASFEKSITLNPAAMNGAAWTSLGSLYYQVPGWPVGFGDDEKAREHLEKGLELGPQDLDAHYFYGDFLAQQKDYAQARRVLQQALATPVDPARPVFQQGRRENIKALLREIESHSR